MILCSKIVRATLIVASLVSPSAFAKDAMNNLRITQLLERLNIETQGQDGLWQLVVNEVEITIITDENADRMRIIAPVAKTDELRGSEYERVLQANFDSALDARYAIAKSMLWSAFIHPLSVLKDRQFLEGIGQVVNLVTTFGTTYHSGSAVFGGGDSRLIEEQELIKNLLERGMAI